MSTKVAINGFGRIGRMVLRALHESDVNELDIVAINDLGSAARLSHLLKYDSVHGPFPGDVSTDGKNIIVKGQNIPVFAERDPANLPWGELGIDIVMECTGFFRDQPSMSKHLEAGAKKVLLSAPAKDDTKTIVYGVNHKTIKASDTLVSNASCTTNALAPIATVLHDTFGIQSAQMTTVHAYTGDQPTHDSLHKDIYRGRAAALSMVPTTTGAAKAIGRVLPELDGKISGVAVRVPTPNVSMVDLTVYTDKPATEESICAAFKKASQGPLKGILGYIEDAVVSTDMNHNPHSSIFVPDQVRVNQGHLVRVMSWYDNEWGFSNRMLDTARVMANAS